MVPKDKAQSKNDAPPRPEVAPGQGGPVRNPNVNDVLSGRGGRINSHTGNVRFREMVESMKREYLDPRTKKLEKARIAARLVSSIRHSEPPGRFLKEDPHTGLWIEIGDERAWKKAGQALRESAPEIRAEQQAQLQAAVKAAAVAGGGSPSLRGQPEMKSSSPEDFSDMGSGSEGLSSGVSVGGMHRHSGFLSSSGASSNGSGLPGRRKNGGRYSSASRSVSSRSGRQASDPPGPRHRPNPPEREGLAMPRQHFELGQYHDRTSLTDQELNMLRHFSQSHPEYNQQQHRQHQFTKQQFQNHYRNSYGGYNHTEQDQLCQQRIAEVITNEDPLPVEAGFVIPALREQQHAEPRKKQQQMHHHETDDEPDEAFGGEYMPISSGATVSTMSSFDVQSMDMSSLGGFSFNQSNNTFGQSATSNLTNGSQASRGGASIARRKQHKTALERKLEKANEAHRRQQAEEVERRRAQASKTRDGQPQDTTIQVPTHPESRLSFKSTQNDHSFRSGHGQSLNSFGFEAIDEDDITEASYKLSNMGLSETSVGAMTFGSDVCSERSRSFPDLRSSEMGQLESNDGSGGTSRIGNSNDGVSSGGQNITSNGIGSAVSGAALGGIGSGPVSAAGVFDQNTPSGGVSDGSSGPVSTGLGNHAGSTSGISHNLGFGDDSRHDEGHFNESFKSMEMDDKGGPVPDPPKSGEMRESSDGMNPPHESHRRRQATLGAPSGRTGRRQDPSGGRLPSHGVRGGLDDARNRRGSVESMGRDSVMGAFGVSLNSIRSFQSQSSDASSWLNQYNHMESIGSDKNPWDDEESRGSSAMSDISAPRMVSVDMSGREVGG